MARIVLIHGLWMTPKSWDDWVNRYEGQGHEVLAPAWPGVDAGIEPLRRDPSPLKGLGLTEIVDHYDGIVRGLDSPPILMGHSFGGLVVQLLLDRGLGAAGVAIDAAPAKGVLQLPFSTLRTAWPALRNPFGKNGIVPLSPKQFRYRFGNLLSEEESREVYDQQYIPGPARPLFQAGYANFNPRAASKVNYRNDTRAPLLFIAGGKDHISPASLNRANFKKFGKSKAVTMFKEFPERSHYTVGQDGWENVADYALTWAVDNTPEGQASFSVRL